MLTPEQEKQVVSIVGGALTKSGFSLPVSTITYNLRQLDDKYPYLASITSYDVRDAIWGKFPYQMVGRVKFYYQST